MLCTDNKPSLIPRFLALVAVAALGLLTIVGSSKEEEEAFRALVEGRPITVNYTHDGAITFYYRDGDGPLREGPTGPHMFNVTDPAGRYDAGVVCNFRGELMGYYIRTTVDDTDTQTYFCDNSNVDATSIISGTFPGVDLYVIHIGMEFGAFAMSPYVFPYIHDADNEPDERDILVQYGVGVGLDHLRWFRSTRIEPNITVNHTFDPADQADSFTIDVSAFISDLLYLGTESTIITENQTRAVLNFNNIDPIINVFVPPIDQVQPGDIRATTVQFGDAVNSISRIKYMLSGNLTINVKGNNVPPDMVTEGQDLTVTWDNPWDPGVPGERIAIVGSAFRSSMSTPPINWTVATTENRFDGVTVAWLPTDELAGLPSFDPTWPPAAADHTSTYGISTNRTVQDVIEARKELSTNHDGLNFSIMVRFN